MEIQMTETEKAERLNAYCNAFYDVWAEDAKGHVNHSPEATVEGPLKMADDIADAYFEDL